jgi:zinc/manganese transport system ATP-binding protein
MNAIEFKHLSLAYGQRCIFQDFTANIQSGEFVAILGANGAGKSTLLRAILGLINPVQGHISLFGHEVHKGASFIGYMPQMRQNVGNNSLSAYAWLGANLNGYQWGFPLLNAQQKKELSTDLIVFYREGNVNVYY